MEKYNVINTGYLGSAVAAKSAEPKLIEISKRLHASNAELSQMANMATMLADRLFGSNISVEGGGGAVSVPLSNLRDELGFAADDYALHLGRLNTALARIESGIGA
jgi:hypothetical protein